MSNTGALDLQRRHAAPDSEGVWMSVSEIARLKGVEKSSISRRIKRLIEAGRLEAKAGPGGQKLVKLAAYDRAFGEVGDAPGGRTWLTGDYGAPPLSKGGGLAREQARRVAYQADLAKLDLDERRAKVLAVERVRSAAVRAVEKIAAHLASIPSVADRVAEAVARDGARGARDVIKNYVFDLQNAIAGDFRPHPDAAETTDDPWPMAPDALARHDGSSPASSRAALVMSTVGCEWRGD